MRCRLSGCGVTASDIARVKLRHLYELNLALLITHEIDAAFWHEWELFRMPGGIQVFLVLNFALVAVFVYGLSAVLLERRSASSFSVALAGAGVLTFVLHAAFLLAGSRQFRSPVSLLLLVAIAITSSAQLILNRTHRLPV